MFSYENEGANTYLVYQLESQDKMDTLSLGMVSNNNIPGIAKEFYTQMNTEKYIKYNISAKISLEQLFDGTINKKRILDVFFNICATLVEAEEYMLDASVFIWNAQYIYVDISTNEVSLLCKPTVPEDTNMPDLKTFFKELIFGVSLDSSEDNSYFTEIINYLNGKEFFTVIDFRNLLQKLRTSGIEVKKGVSNLSVETRSVQEEEKPQTVHVEHRETPMFDKAGSPVTKIEVHQNTEPKKENASLAKIIAIKEQQKHGGTQTAAAREQKQERTKGLFGKKSVEKSKEKSGGGLFSAKKKGKTASDMDLGFIIPGQSVASVKTEDVAGNYVVSTISGNNAGQPIVRENNMHVQIEANVMQQETEAVSKPANFGNTTVLDAPKGSSHPTVVLSELNTQQAAAHIPYLLRIKNNEKVELIKEKITIGKEAGFVDYVIQDNATISRCHAALFLKGEQAYIMDMNSSNHTYVNGGMITSNQEVALHDQDHIKLSNEEFIYMA